MNGLPQSASSRRLEFVLQLVLELFPVSRSEIFSRRRTKTVARARQMAMASLREGCGFTSTEIGEMFRRDVGCVSHAVEKLRPSAEFQHVVRQVKEAFPGG